MRKTGKTSKTLRARELGVSRGTLYYQLKQPEKDWRLKCQTEEVLRKHPSYGSPRISLELKRNHKPIERVMKIFGIKAYRRRGKKWKKTKNIKIIYPICFSENIRATPTISGNLISLTFRFREKLSIWRQSWICLQEELSGCPFSSPTPCNWPYPLL